MYTYFLLRNKSSWRNLWFTVKKWRRKHDNTSVMCLDWVFPSDYLAFRRHFRHKIEDFSKMTCFSVKKVYTWKMRKSEPDSKYFDESLGFLSIPCLNPQKTTQNCARYLLCGFLRNGSNIISMLCGHKIALCSHCCHFMDIGSWKVLFKPQLRMVARVRDVSVPLRAGARAAWMGASNCMKM